jgi:hypothetical protein
MLSGIPAPACQMPFAETQWLLFQRRAKVSFQRLRKPNIAITPMISIT